jgi:hypothetical protein
VDAAGLLADEAAQLRSAVTLSRDESAAEE